MDRGMGWRPDTPDIRDRYLRLPRHTIAAAASSSDLRANMPSVYDQGNLGSCTANAIAAAMEHRRSVQRLRSYTPSRLFIYYNERDMEGATDSDAGAMLRDGIKSVNVIGAVSEEHWPYVVDKFAERPPQACYDMAPYDAALTYERIDVEHRIDTMRAVLTGGSPVVFGFTVYESFESDAVAKTGIVPMPRANEQALGGHAVLACGHNDGNKRFLVRNSWGDGWGERGYCWMPYDYLANADLADDFWHVDMVGHRK